MKTTLFCIILMITAGTCYSQTVHQAVIVDALTDIPLERVSVSIPKSGHRGTFTDAQGRFQINIFPKDSVKMSCIGYNSASFLAKNLPDTIYLLTESILLKGVIVSADAAKKLLKLSVSNLADKLACNNVSIKYDLNHTDSVDGRLMRTCNTDMLLHIKKKNKNKTLKMDWYITNMRSKQIDSTFYAQHTWLNDSRNLNTVPPINVLIEENRKFDKQLLYEFESNNEDYIIIHSFPKSEYKDKFVESHDYISTNDTILLKRILTYKITNPEQQNADEGNIRYRYHVIEQNATYSFKESSAGYYLESLSFYLKFQVLDADFGVLSQHLQNNAISEPMPYQKEHKPKLKQRRVWASSYLFNYAPY